jgi:hypothetical protein
MKGMRDGYRNECRACNLQQKQHKNATDPRREIRRVQQWRKDNPERYAAYQKRRRSRPEDKAADRAGHLKHKFGLTPAEYEAKLAAQGGGCALCGRVPAPGRQLDIDHDHKTGAVRGLVCNTRNQGLGQFRDDPIRLAYAAAYLLHWDRPENPPRVRLLIGG